MLAPNCAVCRGQILLANSKQEGGGTVLLGRAVGLGEKVAHTKTEAFPCRCWELDPCHRKLLPQWS